REVLVHGVVAMVDIGTAVFTELNLELDGPGGAQSPDVLSNEPFGRGDRAVPPIHGDTLFEVEVDRMIPASAAVDVGPVLDVSGLRVLERDPVGVHGMGGSSVDLDDPGERRLIRAVGDALTIGLTRVSVPSSPLDDPCPDGSDDGNLLSQGSRHHARIRVG